MTAAGPRVLVTGASRNLGAAIAHRFARDGATVAVTGHHDVEALHRVRDGLPGPGQHVALVGDLADPDATADLAAEAEARLGGVDVLVHNAGPFSGTPFLRLPTEEWRRTMDANLTAAMVLARELAPGMIARGRGRIVTLAAGSSEIRDHATYGVAKAALRVLTESLALELGPQVTVNAVSPGQIAESAPEAAAIDPDFVERALARTATGRLVTRAEVADLVAALVSPTFDAVTGVVLPVDGGWRLNRS